MRVLLVTTAFPRGIEDSEGTFIYQLGRALMRRGVEVQVLAMHMPGAHLREAWEGMQIHRPAYWRPVRWEALRREPGGLPVSVRRHPWRLLQLPAFCMVHAFTAMGLARQVDLLHAHWTLSALCAQPARRLQHKPLVGTVQGSDLLQASYGFPGSTVASLVLGGCDLVTALSRRLADRASELGVPAERLAVIPNGVDVEWFSPPQVRRDDPVVLYVGSLIERKGVRFLIEAAPAVAAALPKVRFVIAGDGPQRQKLEGLSTRLGVSSRIQFLGVQPPTAVRGLMHQAALLVLPSVQEGFGVVLVESLACGTPVVASDVDGIRDVVRPDAGLLVPPRDSQSLGQALIGLLGDPSRRRRMGQAARELAVDAYSWDRLSAVYISHYNRLLARARRNGT